jgi:Tol biopolymer transport system component
VQRAAVLVSMLFLAACGSGSNTASQAENGPIALSGQPSLDAAQGLFLRDPNGSLSRLTSAKDARDLYPSWSHDGERIAFLRTSRDLESGTGRLLVANADGSDVHQLGSVVATVAQIGWAPDDDALAFTGINSKVWRVNDDGTGAKQIWGEEAHDPSWSPDGKRILVARFAGKGLTTIDVDTGEVRELTHPGQPARALLPDLHIRPAWSPDGKRIAFVKKVWLPSKDLLYPTTIEIVSSDGTGERTLTKVFDESSVNFSWSPDGRSIAFTDYRGVEIGLWVIPSGGGEPRLLIPSGNYSMPSWGPAGA